MSNVAHTHLMKLVSSIAAVLIASASAMAQQPPAARSPAAHQHDHAAAVEDATVTLPHVYTLQLENDFVKVTRVHYAPHAKLPAHAHTALASAYVYLNDSGPVVFKHIGGNNGAITRAPTVKGGFRLFRAVPGEIHEVENPSPHSSDFLRVEFKTDPVEPRTLRGKYLPEPTFDAAQRKVQFENGQVRVSRLFWPRGQSIALTGEMPALLVSLSDGSMGQVRWLPKGHAERLENATLPAMDALLFELKTAPR
jgi:hypothetical protein